MNLVMSGMLFFHSYLLRPNILAEKYLYTHLGIELACPWPKRK